ncbi:MAG: transcriptional repressor NrdR [Gammaproteobacteria bacterium]|jgi:transcriptional repressor NrdR|tara:strand:- start:719 stop:1246 length:528 start_codon:yes stop_codon:yes gene_type:complete
MYCPFCGHEETKVIDSRLAGEGRQIRRRRECVDCHERFSTYETPELVVPRIVKRDDSREPFDEQKLRNGIVRAVEKRPVSAETVEAMVARIIHKLQTVGEREIPARELGDLVMEELRSVDEVAYVRFASVYRSFQDVTQFEDEIRKLQQMPSPALRRDQLSLLPRDRGDGKGKKK